jgi:hypothetical protein
MSDSRETAECMEAIHAAGGRVAAAVRAGGERVDTSLMDVDMRCSEGPIPDPPTLNTFSDPGLDVTQGQLHRCLTNDRTQSTIWGRREACSLTSTWCFLGNHS